MKTTILALSAAFLCSFAALADDSISVTVNGRTYQCSGQSSGGNNCLCYQDNGNWRAKYYEEGRWYQAGGYFSIREECEVATRTMQQCK
jgi:hypothetical protein